jgi:esterase/lipase superfamily enzyme
LLTDLTLYCSSGDTALKMSQQLHKWARAGETGNWVPPGETRFVTVDCSGVDFSKNVGHNLLGHSYYGSENVTLDFQSVLGTSTAPRPATRTSENARYLALPPKKTLPNGRGR